MNAPYREREAVASAWLADHLTAEPIWSPPDQAVIFVRRPVQLAFEVTASCSSVIIACIFFFGSALLAALAPRFRLSRIVMAFAVAVVLAVLINLSRVMLIILASSEWSGGIGFQLSHEYVGSFLAVFGMAFAMMVYLFLLARGRSPAPPT